MEKRIGPLLRVPQEALSLVSWAEEAKVLHRVASLGSKWDTITKHLDNVDIQVKSVKQSYSILSRYRGDENYVSIREFARRLVKDRENAAAKLRRHRTGLVASLESTSTELMHYADMNLHVSAEGVKVSPQLASRKNYLHRVETCLARRVAKIVEDWRKESQPAVDDVIPEDLARPIGGAVKRRRDAESCSTQHSRQPARRRTQSKDPILATTSSESPQVKTQELMRSLIDAAVTSMEDVTGETESPPDTGSTPSDADLRSTLLQ